MAMGSLASLKSSFMDMSKLTLSDANRVSPSKGALFISVMLSRVTVALGKLLKRVKSASEKSKVALMLLFTFSLMIPAILPFKKNGAATRSKMITKNTPPTIFKIFFFI